MRSSFTYEKMAQNEIAPSEEPGDAQALEALEADTRAFLERHPAESLPVPPRVSPWPGLTAAAALLVVVGLGLGVPWSTLEPDTRVKSADQSLLVYHKTAAGSELLDPASRLGQGDEVQFAYRAPEHRYVAIVSVDGRGTLTAHLPLSGQRAIEVNAPGPELLPYSYRLDDAPDFEAIVLVSCAEPFELMRIQPFVKAWAQGKNPGLGLPDGFESTSFRIAKKETTR